jgi:hypothetical protein
LNWNNAADVLILVGMVALFIGAIIYRQRRNSTAPMLIVFNLYRDIDKNMKLVNRSSQIRKAVRFKTKAWRKSQTHLDFLNEELRSAINAGFRLADEFNTQIENAKKTGAVVLLSTLPVESLTEPMTKAKTGLGEWIREHWGDRSLMPKRIGFFN